MDKLQKHINLWNIRAHLRSVISK